MKGELEQFKTTDLHALKQVRLLDRFDTKFVFHTSMLHPLFEHLAGCYQILEINGTTSFHYRSLYLDTQDLYFYRQHHDQRVNRYKLRFRQYTDTRRCFFEVKFKNNKEKTLKKRLKLDQPDVPTKLSGKTLAFAHEHLNGNTPGPECVHPTLWVSYNRITMTHPSSHERLTIDRNLSFSDGNRTLTLDSLVIAELKHSGMFNHTPFSPISRTLSLTPCTFSKYCMGVVFFG